MAFSVQPVDGLIHRLLQQNGKTPSISNTQGPSTHSANDRVSLSSHAQANTSALVAESQLHPHQKPGEKALESHLLNLYRSNDRFGG